MPQSEKGQTEIITLIKIPGKDRGAKPSDSRWQNFFKLLALAFIFLVMVAGGAWLLHKLAKNSVDTPNVINSDVTLGSRAKEKSVAIPKDQPTKTRAPAELGPEKEKAEQNLADFTIAKNELENKGAREWGSNLYDEMIQLSQEADAFLMKKDYVTASEKYRDATARAKELAGQIDGTFQRMLEEGRIASYEGDSERAQQKFRVALLIDPTSESAQQGFEQAKKIETVIRLIESGKRHEKNDDLSFAYADYQEALRLDPEFKEAQKASTRIKNQIKKQEFQKLMSEGMAAFHDGKWQVAEAKFLKAQSFRPESQEVRDALTQVDQAIRLAQIEELRKHAVKAENSENWDQALKSHLAVLKIDKNVQFALQGKERTSRQLLIEKRISFFLQNPSVLESNRQLENAVLLVEEVEKIEPKGPRLTARFEELKQLIKAAQTPVRITIESDTFTEVAIYKVGKLGRFAVREINLRPGTYIVVGERDGYKDVRQNIVIKPEQGALRIIVICNTKI